MTTTELARRPAAARSGILELVGSAALAGLCFALLSVGLFLFRIYSIPARSGLPALMAGDYMIASRYAYGFSRYSLPLGDILPWPVSRTLLRGSEPKRGDIAVFKLPKDNATDYIKRVIGLPGDRIQVIEGVLNINGKPVDRERIADYEVLDAFDRVVKVAQYTETLPGGATYRVIERDGDQGFWDNTEVYTVPPGHFFTMGDNRDNSTDSRDLAGIGYVPLKNFIGRADRVLFSFAEAQGGDAAATRALRWGRFMMSIR